tara:strand:- start:4712 stop:5110 length:399 start_codon:yes stop_codon:yes gene_type:complete
MRILKVCVTAAYLSVVIVSNAQAKVPVKYGVDENVDACSTLGHVEHLSSGPDGFLAVKDAPNIKALRIDKIFNGQKLWICDESKDGKWLGVVYTSDAKLNCGVSSPIETRKKYPGPCKSGWVSKKYVTVDAG